jgi:autotransporter family porin
MILVVSALVLVLVGWVEASGGRDSGGPVAAAERFGLLPPGATLPTSAQCAALVRPAPEVRWGNQRPNRFGVVPNQTRGVAHVWVDSDPSKKPFTDRVDGNFVGTTDEIIQWAACKWGVDEDYVRAQIVTESYWDQVRSLGDWGTNPANCEPRFPLGTDGRAGQCPESFGLGQTRYPFMRSAFPYAYDSSAFNLDVTYAIWRACFEGTETWLNTVERGREYAKGDMLGCMGRWFAGRWYTQPAVNYMNIVQGHVNSRTWETAGFLAYDPPPSTTTTTRPPTTTTTTRPPTTTTTTSTTVPSSTTTTSTTSTTSTTTTTSSTTSTTTAVPTERPSAPRDLSARRGNGSVTLIWKVPTSNGGSAIVDYIVQRSPSGGSTWTTVPDGVSTARRTTVGGLTNGQRYDFRVAAVNAAGSGPWSEVASAMPASKP